MSLLQIGKRYKVAPQLKDRIYLSVSSEGYGHSSRALALARQFQPGEVLIGSYGYALERVRSYDYPSVGVTQEVKFVGSEGHFDVGKTILSNPTRALGFNQIVQEEMDIIKQHGITLVVADGRMAPVLAAERLDIPCIVMTNQSAFYPFFERDSALVKLFGHSFEWVMKLWLSSAEEILIPDFAPPYTICLPNLSDNYQVKKRTRFVGPLVAWQAHEVAPLTRSGHNPLIVASLGGHEYRRPLFDAVIEAARCSSNLDFIIISSFKAENVPSNVQIHPFVKEAAPYFKAADLVITQAGHSTAMELLTLGTPSLIVPDSLQIEQENNARRMVELGVSLKMEYEDFLVDSSQAALRWNIQKLLESPEFGARTREFSDRAAEVHGAKEAANHLREFAHRLSAY